MALDHYVSQVHLKNFYAETLNRKKMYAIRKSDLKSFPCGSADVCRIEGWSTTQYLGNPRIIEDFIRPIESKYNWACSQILNNQISSDVIFIIAGFASFINICSPTSIRIMIGSLEHDTKISAQLLDKAGLLPKSPPELGGKSLSELFDEDQVEIETDANFPKALSISNFYKLLRSFGNFHWDILLNDDLQSPFLTSDFPLAVEESSDPRIINRVLPLTPNLAVRIRPSLHLSETQAQSDKFENFRFRRAKLKRAEVRRVNELIVRSAENMVFSSINLPWVARFVERNRRFSVKGVYDETPNGTGFNITTRTRVQET